MPSRLWPSRPPARPFGSPGALTSHHSLAQMMTLLLLLDDERMRAHQWQLCAHVASLVSPRLRPLEANLAEHFSNPLRWHVSGYRYLFHDRPNRTVRCSPSTKVRRRPWGCLFVWCQTAKGLAGVSSPWRVVHGATQKNITGCGLCCGES